MNIAEKMEIFNNQQTGASSGFERNLAFIIGIDNYQNGIPSLKTAANDAKKFAEVLESKHQYQARICLNSDATLSNLYQFLEEILPAQVTENDRLLFYFAGHGTIDGEGDDGPTGYFLPQDAIRGEITTYLPMTRLYESLNKLPCRHFLGILDCCFAGAFRWLTTRDLLTSPDKIYQERYERYIQDPAWQIITAAAYDQKALDVDPFAFERGQIGNHSPFTGALLEALSGTNKDNPFSDGVITAQKLSSYLRDRVEPATAAINRRQTPVLIPLRRHDKGEYIFLSPGHPLNLELAPPLNEKDNPYKGLLSFEEEDSKLFFGRKALTQQLCERVIQQPLTIVLGASGSGKSSLVKAGLIPYIKENYQHWHILSPIRPGESPFRALRNAFAKDNLPVAAVTTLGTQQKVDSLFANIDTWFNLNSNSGLLIVIDQLEELVTLAYNEQEREAFLQFLATALKKYPQRLRIVFTLRIDFEAQLRNHALETYWQATGARFLVEDMTREELRQVIEEPASKAVIFFEPHSLVENLIDEVYRMPGALPLLSFTLSELYLKYFSSVRLLDLQSNSIREFKAHPNEVNSVSWSQDGQKISTIGDGGDDSPDTPNNNCKVKDGQKISTMEDGGDDSPDTPNNNSSVKLWDTKGKFLDKLDKKQGDGRSNFQSISFQSDGNPVIISKGDIDQDTGNINSLDLSGNQVNIIPGRQSRNHLQKVEISHDASLLLTTEDATTDTKKENILALWNLKGGNLMTFSVNNDIKSLSLSNDNSMLAVMTKDGKTELWQLGKFDELLSKGCERARNYLQNNPNVAKSDRNLCDDVGQ